MTYFCPRCHSADIRKSGHYTRVTDDDKVNAYQCNACDQIFSCIDDGKPLNRAFKGTSRRFSNGMPKMP